MHFILIQSPMCFLGSKTDLFAVFRKLESLYGKHWPHTLGDGKSSERIANDLHRRIVENDFARHGPEHYHVPVARSYRGDGLSEDGRSLRVGRRG